MYRAPPSPPRGAVSGGSARAVGGNDAGNRGRKRTPPPSIETSQALETLKGPKTPFGGFLVIQLFWL